VGAKNGVHVLTVYQLRQWAYADTALVEVEVDGDILIDIRLDMTIVRRARPIRVVPGWTNEAIRRWAFECADRAVRIHVPPALRAAGLAKHADRLASLPPVRDASSLSRADRLLSHARRILRRIGGGSGRVVGGVGRFSVFENASYALYNAADVGEAVAAARSAALNGVSAASYYGDAAAERIWQSRRLAELVGLDPEPERG
jgi:hypothetical protein